MKKKISQQVFRHSHLHACFNPCPNRIGIPACRSYKNLNISCLFLDRSKFNTAIMTFSPPKCSQFRALSIAGTGWHRSRPQLPVREAVIESPLKMRKETRLKLKVTATEARNSCK
jgi:hypothetical protein